MCKPVKPKAGCKEQHSPRNSRAACKAAKLRLFSFRRPLTHKKTSPPAAEMRPHRPFPSALPPRNGHSGPASPALLSYLPGRIANPAQETTLHASPVLPPPACAKRVPVLSALHKVYGI